MVDTSHSGLGDTQLLLITKDRREVFDPVLMIERMREEIKLSGEELDRMDHPECYTDE